MSQCNKRGCTGKASKVIVFRDPLTGVESTACVCATCALIARRIMRQALGCWSNYLEQPAKPEEGAEAAAG